MIIVIPIQMSQKLSTASCFTKPGGLNSRDEIPIDQNQLHDGKSVDHSKVPLCHECIAIDFDKVFALSFKELGHTGKPITGSRRHLNKRCKMCAMIGDMLAVAKNGSSDSQSLSSEYHLRACDSLRQKRQKRIERLVPAQNPDIIIIVAKGNATRNISITDYDKALRRGVIVQSECPGRTTTSFGAQYKGRKIESLSINFSLVADWLKTCQESCHHEQCRKSVRLNSFGFYVIRCSDRRVIPLLEGMEYLALSYVWGSPGSQDESAKEYFPEASQNDDAQEVDVLISGVSATDQSPVTLQKNKWARRRQARRQKKMEEMQPSQQQTQEKSQPTTVGGGQERVRTTSLPLILPKTIEDAISVVMAIGKQYLWVDRYCIPPWTDKHVQIQNMHLIYHGAIATIVAVDPDPNSSARSGLFGVSIPRNPQRKALLYGHHLLLTQPHISHHLSRSKWATRGWTFQEARLSRRCLFFTEGQVYYACQSIVRSEDVNQLLPDRPLGGESLNGSIVQPENSTSLDESKRTFDTHDSNVFGDIEEYSTRSLTYDADIINALRGVLSSYPFPTLWGIPAAAAAAMNSEIGLEKYFVISLLWIPSLSGSGVDKSSSPRRPGFPTWSWASLPGRIQFMCSEIKDLDTPLAFRYAETLKRKDDAPYREESLSEYLGNTKAGEISNRWTPVHLQIRGQVEHVMLHWSKEYSCWKAHQTLGEGANQKRVYVGTVTLDPICSEELSTRICAKESQWAAVKLMYLNQKDTLLPMAKYFSYWLLLDRRGGYYRRIGLMLCNEQENNILHPPERKLLILE
jgi:hypothetical protein